MGNILTEGVRAQTFLEQGIKNGYSMEPNLIPPEVAMQISRELETANLLFDLNEQNDTARLHGNGMRFAGLLHNTLTRMVRSVDSTLNDPLPLFSVRVFEPRRHGTTIHRNHRIIGPWAIGITLRGEAPFNVYEDHQLQPGSTLELQGDEEDPYPLESMDTVPGSAWTLYTANERVPHSSGIVDSKEPRELLILYGMKD